MTWQRESQRSIDGYAIWGFLALWVVSVSIAGVIGLAAADLPVVGMPSYSYQDDNAIGPLIVWGLGLIFFTGSLIGVAQALPLWLFKQVSGLQALAWVTVTLLGSLLAVFIGTILAVAAGGAAICVWPLVPGAMLGLAQWLLLRRLADNAGWWIGANTLGWLVGVLVGWLVFAYLLPPTEVWFPFYPAQAANNWAIAWAAGMVAFSAVTGVAFVWISRPQS